MLSEFAHFSMARRYCAPLLVGGTILAGLGVGVIASVWAYANARWPSGVPVPPSLGYLGGALSIAAAGLLSAGVTAFVRLRLLLAESQQNATPPTRPALLGDQGRLRHVAHLLAWAKSLLPPLVSTARLLQVLLVVLFAGLSLTGILIFWPMSAPPIGNPVIQQVLGGSLVVAAFPLLVLERAFANISAEALPEAAQIDRLLRVPLTACVVLGIFNIIEPFGFAWVLRLDQALAVLIALVSVELIVRGVAMVFVPFDAIERRQTVADSSIAGLMQFRAPNFHALNGTIQRQFGIDLSRSWALAFLLRATVPIVIGMGMMAWGVTGITALALNERAVYERFGVPVAVLGPGLHFHLPWPLGVIRGVEFGAIHDIPVALLPAAISNQTPRLSAAVDKQAQAIAAEDPPPAAADRLWDTSHPSEQSYLIASEARGEQGFQVVDADLRVVYRVGLSDAAAIASAYHVEHPENLIRAVVGRLLVGYFSRYTLLDVIGQNREVFANELRVSLQDQLDRLSSGIEAIAVVVEAIHPPPGAASAYHNVQAVEIEATSAISLRRADAIRAMTFGKRVALQERADAVAAAAELIGQARAESILFRADREARERYGEVFLLERRFERLVSALKKAELIVIDHRVDRANPPTIDLRTFSNSGSAARRD